MVPSVMDLLFGCSHRRFGFPITPNRRQRRPAAALVTGTYVVCLDCGQEFPYDWERMKVVSLRQAARSTGEVVDALARKAA